VGGAATGYLLGPLSWVERAVAVLAASFLIVALPVTDEIGFALSGLFVGWHWWRTRALAPRPA
jgi:TRAP-type uncharacterized transport system fused permease subunit